MSVRHLVAALVCAVALLVVPASAATAAPRGVLGVSGSTGTGDGQFQGTGGVAVNESTGDVYVIDMGGNRIERFNAAGEFQDAFGSAGAGNGQLDFSGGRATFQKAPQLAIDQSDGAVYAADIGNDRVQKFSAAGAYQDQFGTSGAGAGEFSRPQGVAVDPTDGSVYVADTGNYRVQKFTSAGAYVSQFGSMGDADGQFSEPCPDPEFVGNCSGAIRVGVDSAGRVYVLDYFKRLQRFTSAGAFDAVIDTSAFSSYLSDLAVDQTGDHAFVGNYFGQVAEFDGAGVLGDVHPVGTSPIAGASLTGVSVKASALAYAAGADGYDGSNDARLFRFGVVAPATVSLQPVTGIEGRSATINATINPNGPPIASYQIEVSTDGVDYTAQPATPVDVGDGASDVSISRAVTGLEPNTFYVYRIVVKRAYNADIVSDLDSFSTLAVRPNVSSVVAAPTETGARLSGSINPNGIDTTYQFEYGLTDTYGKTFPATPTSVGDGRGFAPAAAVIGGLDPNITYHFRIVATNAAGTTNGSDQTFTTKTTSRPGGGLNLPAYEQVSPPDKGGSDVIPGRTIQLSPDGNAVAFASSGAFGSAQSSVALGYFVARRGPQTWTTTALGLPQFTDETINFQTTSGASQNLNLAVQVSREALTPGAVRGHGNVYLQNLRTGALTLMSSMATDTEIGYLTGPYNPVFVGVSDDFSRILLQSYARLTPDAVASYPNLYLWDGDQLVLVSVYPDGSPMSTSGAVNKLRNISADGRRVFFEDEGTADHGIYMWEDGHSTLLTGSQRAGAAPDAVVSAVFYGASADGTEVLMVAREPITDDPRELRGSLLRMNVGTRDVDNLTPSVGGAEPGVLPVYGATPDLGVVYFAASGSVVDGAPATTQDSIYVHKRDGTNEQVAQLSGLSGLENANSFAMSRDGRFAALSASNVIGYMETSSRCGVIVGTGGFPTDHECLNVIVFDAQTGDVKCASCIPGQRPMGHSSARTTVSDRLISNYRATSVLDSGEVFFNSDKALVPGDANGTADVYRWRAGAGPSLVSPGIGENAATFVGTTLDGSSVFFTTNERLVGQDRDGNIDLYVARRDGGLPGQGGDSSTKQHECADDACQGPSAAPATAQSAGSITFDDSGSRGALQPSTSSRTMTVSRPETITGTAATLRVTLRAAGTMRASGSGIVSRERTVGKAGVYSLKVALTSKARLSLRKKAVMKVAVRVSFRSAAGKTTSTRVTLTFRQPRLKAAKRRAAGSDASAKGGR